MKIQDFYDELKRNLNKVGLDETLNRLLAGVADKLVKNYAINDQKLDEEANRRWLQRFLLPGHRICNYTLRSWLIRLRPRVSQSNPSY